MLITQPGKLSVSIGLLENDPHTDTVCFRNFKNRSFFFRGILCYNKNCPTNKEINP